MSKLVDSLLFQIKVVGLPEPVKEYRFHDTRRWRFDLCYKDRMLAIEVDGGIYINGRHNRGSGYEKDCVKYSEAMLLGWNVYRCTAGMIKNGYAVNTIERLFKLLEG